MVLTMVSNIDYNINIFVLHLCVFQHDLFFIYLYNMIGSNMIVDVYDNMTALDNMFCGNFEFNSFGFASVNILLTTAVSTAAAIFVLNSFSTTSRLTSAMTELVNIAVVGEPTYVSPTAVTLAEASIKLKSTLLTSTDVSPDNLGLRNGPTPRRDAARSNGSLLLQRRCSPQ